MTCFVLDDAQVEVELDWSPIYEDGEMVAITVDHVYLDCGGKLIDIIKSRLGQDIADEAEHCPLFFERVAEEV